MNKLARWSIAALLLAACEPQETEEPTGVDVPNGPCGHALYVVSSDYQSTSAAIIGYDGGVLAPSMIDSGSDVSGLSVALSGDVVTPTTRTTSGSVVLIDRSASAVLTFLDPTTASVEQQISVQTGFIQANPQDVLEIASDKIYVSRYGANPEPGVEEFDEGSDVLVVDPQAGAIVGRIDLAGAMAGAAEDIEPHPSRMVGSAERAYVLLSAYSRDFSKSDDGRIAVLDSTSDTIADTLVLSGARGCYAFAIAPSGTRLAVGCSGTFNLTSTPNLDDSALLVLDLVDGGLTIAKRFDAVDIGDAPIGQSIAFVGDDTLMFSTMGQLDDAGSQRVPDRLLELDIAAGDTRELLRTESVPFTIGDMRCETTCGICFVADGDRNVVQRMEIDGAGVGALEAISIDDGIGLPPRYVGAY
ncbi:MAG: hypothetical protein HOW73_21115 [Polyangiaceae bacterium]|nr:hypothetical protein [Polyangiaceae bacterium]